MWSLLVLAASCLSPPVDAPVIEVYRPPACLWCAGHRGIKYGSAEGDEVRAVLPGRVLFAGHVVSANYVTIADGAGRRLTYGGLDRIDVALGQWVVAGQVVGLAGGVVQFSVRRGDAYEDPSLLLHGRTPARLVRVDGRRRPPSGSISCGSASAGSLTQNMTRTPPAVALRRIPR